MQTLKVSTISAYVQDEYTLTEKLKITAGLRGDVVMYDNSTAADFYNPVVGGLTFTDKNGQPTKISTNKFPSRALLLSPRLGFNYDVDG